MLNKTGETAVLLDMPIEARNAYMDNYFRLIHESDRLMLFAGDQKIEHLNDDSYGLGMIHVRGAAGNATGRNIHQKPIQEAVKSCNAIYAITVENTGIEGAWEVYSGD